MPGHVHTGLNKRERSYIETRVEDTCAEGGFGSRTITLCIQQLHPTSPSALHEPSAKRVCLHHSRCTRCLSNVSSVSAEIEAIVGPRSVSQRHAIDGVGEIGPRAFNNGDDTIRAGSSSIELRVRYRKLEVSLVGLAGSALRKCIECILDLSGGPVRREVARITLSDFNLKFSTRVTLG
jgi:hypothetical protein